MTVKAFACTQVLPGCSASFRGSDDDEILVQVAAHARDDHGLAVISADLIAIVRQHIVAA